MSAWLRPRWLLGHLVIGVIAAVCLRLGWWQWEHALRGDGRSLGTRCSGRCSPRSVCSSGPGGARAPEPRRPHVWAAAHHGAPVRVGQSWSFRRDDTDAGPVLLLTPSVEITRQDEHDPDAAAYMHRMRWLNADPRRRLSDYPGFDGH
ncbi:hypothetical protein NKG94_51570 [Micromonospora sp. M12]